MYLPRMYTVDSFVYGFSYFASNVNTVRLHRKLLEIHENV